MLAAYVDRRDVVCSRSAVRPGRERRRARVTRADETLSGNPETQSVSNAGRRSANKGPSLFLTAAYFHAGGSRRPHCLHVDRTFISPLACCFVSASRRLRGIAAIIATRYFFPPTPLAPPLPFCAAMTGVQGKAHVG